MASLVPAAPRASADEAPPPGLVDLTRFSRAAEDESPLVEVSLSGALLDLAAGSLAGQDPAIAESIGGLDSVRVIVLSLDGSRFESASGDLDAMQKELAGEGWQSVARVRDETSSVNVLLLEREGRVLGLTVGALDRGERQLVLVNIAGRFDPQHLAGLLRRLGAQIELPRLDVP